MRPLHTCRASAEGLIAAGLQPVYQPPGADAADKHFPPVAQQACRMIAAQNASKPGQRT